MREYLDPRTALCISIIHLLSLIISHVMLIVLAAFFFVRVGMPLWASLPLGVVFGSLFWRLIASLAIAAFIKCVIAILIKSKKG